MNRENLHASPTKPASDDPRHEGDDVEPDAARAESDDTARDHAAEATDPSGDIASGGGEHPA